MTIFVYDEKEDNILNETRGGAGEISQQEYLDICVGLVSDDQDKKVEGFNKLIDILKDRVNKEIKDLKDDEKELARLKTEYPDEPGRNFTDMLLNETQKTEMNNLFNKLWDDLDNDKEETDYILKFNIACWVCEGIFIEYSTNKDVPKVVAEKRGAPQPYRNPNIILNYSDGKKLEDVFYKISIKPVIYFIIFVLPFLGITCMFDAWLEHDIWFLGFSTRYGTYDGGFRWGNPYVFTGHDVTHFISVEDDYNKNSIVRQKVKDFYSYCKKNYSGVGLYQIKLILFWLFHEVYYFDFLSKENYDNKLINNEFFDESGAKYDLKKRFTDKNDLYLSLPPKIRKDYEDSNDFEKIEKYFQVGLSVFYDALNNYKKQTDSIESNPNVVTSVTTETSNSTDSIHPPSTVFTSLTTGGRRKTSTRRKKRTKKSLKNKKQSSRKYRYLKNKKH
jgi:hypothetical protein